MPRPLFATVLYICVSALAGLTAQAARAASPYAVDGIALAASMVPAREYQCSASEEFADYTWCQRKRQERGRKGAFSSTNSILHDRDGDVAYVNREIRPAFFAGNDIQTELKRLAARFGAPARQTRLPEHEDLSAAVIAVWGSLQLEELDEKNRAALESAALSQQSLLVDHLGDVRRSLQLGLPIYRLSGGPGYLWSAASNRNGRGHLRFLAIDVAALIATKDVAPPAPKKVAGALAAAKDAARPTSKNDVGAVGAIKDVAHPTPKKDAGARTATKGGAALAAIDDLRPFLTPQPTSIVPNDAGKSLGSQSKDNAQQTIVQKTRMDVERARLMDAERMAAEERTKAQLAWARFEAEKAAYEARARVKWFVVASLCILIGILGLLRVMTRQEQQATAPEARKFERKTVRAATYLWVHRGRSFFPNVVTHFAALLTKARAGIMQKSILAAHERS
jgi:hypothetical protein